MRSGFSRAKLAALSVASADFRRVFSNATSLTEAATGWGCAGKEFFLPLRTK